MKKSKETPNRANALARLAAANSPVKNVEVKKSAEPAASDAVSGDEQHSSGRTEGDLVKPLYHPLLLTQYIESSAELRQIIACMVANTVGYGYRVVQKEHAHDIPDDDLLDEQIELENFLSYVNPDQDLGGLLTETAWDFYLTGWAPLEVTRSPSTGKPDGLFRVPTHQVLLSSKEKKSHRFPMKQLLRTREGYEVKTRMEHKRFRRYAQSPVMRSANGIVSTTKGADTVWFKEFQDDRHYSRHDGKLLKTKNSIKKAKKNGGLAHEMIHISTPVTRGAYGFPCYIGNVMALNGDIKAENINMATFANNNIPSMVIKVSSGQLTEDSVERLAEFAETKFQRDDNRSRFLLLESQSLADDDDETGKSKIDIESLHQTQKEEMMFEKWMDEQRAAVRRSFRLPPILVGRGEAVSGSVVAANMKLADEQVFGQDRALFVSWINRKLLPELGIKNHEVRLNSPNVNDVSTLVEMLRASEKTGAMTPKIARMIIEQIMSMDYGDLPKTVDPNEPFASQMAEIVKKVNESGANNPSGSNDPEKEMNDADPSEPAQQLVGDNASS